MIKLYRTLKDKINLQLFWTSFVNFIFYFYLQMFKKCKQQLFYLVNLVNRDDTNLNIQEK